MDLFYIRLIRHAIDGFFTHNGMLLAGYIAYSTLLALFPFLIFSVSLTGMLIGEDRSAQAVQALFDIAPEHVAKTLEPVVNEVLTQSHSLFTMFILIAVWVAMGAVGGISVALDRAYSDKPNDNWWIVKAKAFVVVIIASGVAVAMGLLILLAPVILRLVDSYTRYAPNANIEFARYIIGIVVFYAFLWSLHRFLPNKHAKGYVIWPGVLTSTILWIAMASGLSIYLSYAGTYTITYGALAGVIVTLLFLYMTGAIVILGAEVNAAFKKMARERG